MTAAPLRNNTRTASGWLKPVIGSAFTLTIWRCIILRRKGAVAESVLVELRTAHKGISSWPVGHCLASITRYVHSRRYACLTT